MNDMLLDTIYWSTNTTEHWTHSTVVCLYVCY